MYKVYALWSAPRPAEQSAFEQHYASVHYPTAAAVPGLDCIAEAKPESIEGAPPAYFRVAEMCFMDKAAFDESASSPEWAAMRADSAYIIEQFGVTLTVAVADVTVTSIATA